MRYTPRFPTFSGFTVHTYRNNYSYLRLIMEKAVDVSDGAVKGKPETLSLQRTVSKPFSAPLRLSLNSLTTLCKSDQAHHTWTYYFSNR